jgi:DNA-binding response OmpR family regulator
MDELLRILVAEDDPIMLALIERQLKEYNFEVQAVPNGKEAILALENFKPHLIITDLIMPYAGGLDVISAVRQRLGTEFPLIVLSALDEEDTVLQAFKMGADDFLTKPVKPGELAVRVKRLLKSI